MVSGFENIEEANFFEGWLTVLSEQDWLRRKFTYFYSISGSLALVLVRCK